MRRHDLLVAIALLNLLEELFEAKTESRTTWQPDRQTFTYHLGEHKEFELFTNLAVVTLLCLFEESQVLVEHLFLWESDTVDTCHHGASLVTTPVSSGERKNLDSLDWLS